VGHVRVEEQYQTEIVRTTSVTWFRVYVGDCTAYGTRVQGRHPRQTSDALGAAASQLGPDAVSLATVLRVSASRWGRPRRFSGCA
jgi:transposase